MQESVIYQDFVTQGLKEGLKQGLEQGLKQGLQQGQSTLVLRQLKRRLGKIESEDETRITGLSVEQLGALGEALLDFSSRDDLLAWLDNNQPF